MSRPRPRQAALMVSMLAALAASPVASAEEKRPNFVFILADDQAWNGLNVRMIPGDDASRNASFRTPNIAGLAAKGITFSQGYASHCKCECSRAALLMGRSTTSLNATEKRSRDWNAPASDSLANTLKRAAPEYRAAHLGKWQWPQSPKSMGYDVSDGITQNEDGNSADPDDPKLSFSLTRRAQGFMQDRVKEGHPFYLQLSYYAVHPQAQALPETLRRYGAIAQEPTGKKAQERKKADAKKKGGGGGGGGDRALLAAMTEDFDGCVGDVLRQLDDLGIADNTYVIYSSDNGGRTGYLSGGKGNLFEGGIRVPLIVRGPGIKAGVYSNEPVVGYDILATVLDLAAPGFAVPRGVEGGSWKPILLDGGVGKVTRPIDRLVFHQAVEVDHPQSALRKGDFKLLYSWDTKQGQLFSLAKDPRESRDLTKEMPELAGALRDELTQHVRAGIGERACAELEKGTPPRN